MIDIDRMQKNSMKERNQRQSHPQRTVNVHYLFQVKRLLVERQSTGVHPSKSIIIVVVRKKTKCQSCNRQWNGKHDKNKREGLFVILSALISTTETPKSIDIGTCSKTCNVCAGNSLWLFYFFRLKFKMSNRLFLYFICSKHVAIRNIGNHNKIWPNN